MNLTRRTFLGGIAAAAACPRVLASAKAAVDPELTVLFSDVHVNGVAGSSTYQRQKFSRVVADILKLDPLPARAICFGDLAYLFGRKEDYLQSAPGLKLLADAGIQVTIGMGNHDRRSTFLEVHPSYAQTTKVPGRIVSVVDAGRVDFIMLDGLQGTDDRELTDMGPGNGRLDAAQQEWLQSVLPKWKKPVFVCSHFPVNELAVGNQKLANFLGQCPAVAGYLHGHDHRWYKTLPIVDWKRNTSLRTLCLPSTGHWGDIGFVTFRTTADLALASLHQSEYFFPNPEPQRPEDRRLWDIITAENQQQTCSFILPKLG